MARTLLIVDDHPSFRKTARAVLESQGFEVIGEAGNGASGITAAARLEPDVVLLDVQLPDIDGFEVARRIMEQQKPPAVVLVSSREAADYGDAVASAPAVGFITKAELSGARIAALADDA